MVLNEATNLTLQKLTYEDVTTISQSPYGIVAGLVILLVPIIFYLIIGGSVKARSSDGRKLSSSMISSPNYWYGFLIMLFITGGCLLITYWFPLWLKIIG